MAAMERAMAAVGSHAQNELQTLLDAGMLESGYAEEMLLNTMRSVLPVPHPADS